MDAGGLAVVKEVSRGYLRSPPEVNCGDKIRSLTKKDDLTKNVCVWYRL